MLCYYMKRPKHKHESIVYFHLGWFVPVLLDLIAWLNIPLKCSVQLLSCVQLFETPRTAANQASLSITYSWSLLRLRSIKSVMPPNHLILCHPHLLPPSTLPSIRDFWNESVLPNRWPKYWNFRFNISPSNEYSGLISFTIDWLDLLAIQGMLKSLLQHHSSKVSILWCSAFFISQEAGQMVWYSHLFKNFPQFLWSTQSKALA